MNNPRRTFLKTSLSAGLGTTLLPHLSATGQPVSPEALRADYAALDAALAKPVLKKELFANPVIIESCELLEYQGNYLCRVRSTDGAEGYCVGHNLRMPHLYPIQLMLVNPYFVGKDAREA